MKMEQTECSETSAYKIQTPEDYPEENIRHNVLLSRIFRSKKRRDFTEYVNLRLFLKDTAAMNLMCLCQFRCKQHYKCRENVGTSGQ